MADADVEHTLREIREQALATSHSTPSSSVPPQTSSAPAARAAHQPLAARRPVRWLKAFIVRLIQSSLVDLRLAVSRLERVDQEREMRVRQLEEEQVRLRQMVLRASEMAELANRGRLAALSRVEELEAQLQRSGGAGPAPR